MLNHSLKAGTCVVALVLSATSADITASEGEERAGGEYLYVWSGDKDGAESDFLAVVDARADQPTYGDVIATLPVGSKGTMPHHAQYEYPDSGILLANGWLASRTFVIDLADSAAPKLIGSFDDALGFSFPHSFAPLDNGNILATFQGTNGNYGAPGGLVELSGRGEPIRAASAVTAGLDPDLTWPYSLAIVPGKDRAVVAISEMGMPPFEEFDRTDTVEIWDTRDLSIVAALKLPETGADYGNLDPAEPRVMEDGRVYVSTFSCGLYRILDVDGAQPGIRFVHLFPGSADPDDACSVPVAVGRYWVQPVTSINGLIALDMSDADAPKEVSRLVLGEPFEKPHWVAADRMSDRLVVTADMHSWVLIVHLDPETGALSIDDRFGGESGPGISFDREDWPHGSSGPAVVHAALFRR